MSISDEISRLEQLRVQGTLTDDEFVEAKHRVLSGESETVYVDGSGKIYGIGENVWCMLMHLSQLISWSGVGLIAPIAMWALSKDESELARRHGSRMMNWLISNLIYMAVGAVLAWTIIGALVGIPILIGVFLLNIAFPIMAAMKCNDGEVWSYPLAIRIFDEE